MQSPHHPVRLALGLVGIGLAVLSAYLYVGPYRWFAELQMLALGSYSPKLALLGAVLLCILPLFGLFALHERTELGRAQSAALEGGLWTTLARAVQRSPRAARLLMIGAVFLGMGGWFAVRALLVGELTPVDVATLEAGQDPPSRFVDLHGGVLDYEHAPAFREGATTYDYVPYSSQDGVPVAVFVELSPSSPEPDPEGAIRGTLEWNGLPGPVRADLEAQGAIASDHWVLNTRQGRHEGFAGTVFVVIGALLALAGGFGMWRGLPRHS